MVRWLGDNKVIGICIIRGDTHSAEHLDNIALMMPSGLSMPARSGYASTISLSKSVPWTLP
jgi:hypothetical protein